MSTNNKLIGNYKLDLLIGQGSFGKVRLATHQLTGHQVAIKIISKQSLKTESDIYRLNQEVQILRKVHYPSIIQLYEVIETAKHVYIVMEYCSKGELSNLLQHRTRLQEREACIYFQQLIYGLDYLHTNGIVHRDIKPSNILFDNQSKIRIIDFGLAGYFQQGEKLQASFGSLGYAAPEVIKGKYYDPVKADIWSAGAVLYRMVQGQLPYEKADLDSVYRFYKSKQLEFPVAVSNEYQDLVTKLLSFKSPQRISVELIKSHCWFTQIRSFTPISNVDSNGQIIVEQQILNQATQYGLDVEAIKQSLLLNKYDSNAAIYLICKNIQSKLQSSQQPNKPYTSKGIRYHTPAAINVKINMKQAFQRKSVSPSALQSYKKQRGPKIRLKLVKDIDFEDQNQSLFYQNPMRNVRKLNNTAQYSLVPTPPTSKPKSQFQKLCKIKLRQQFSLNRKCRYANQYFSKMGCCESKEENIQKPQGKKVRSKVSGQSAQNQLQAVRRIETVYEVGEDQEIDSSIILDDVFSYLYHYSNIEPNEDNYKRIFENLFQKADSDIEMHSILTQPNLVQNSSGLQGFEYWEFQDNQASIKWVVEQWGTYQGNETVFVGANIWMPLVQNINLEGLQGKKYVAGMAYSRRKDCQSHAQFNLKFENDLIIESGVLDCPDEEPSKGFSSKWAWYWTKGIIPDDANQVQIGILSKDSNNWAGNFGARIGEVVFIVY